MNIWEGIAAVKSNLQSQEIRACRVCSKHVTPKERVDTVDEKDHETCYCNDCYREEMERD